MSNKSLQSQNDLLREELNFMKQKQEIFYLINSAQDTVQLRTYLEGALRSIAPVSTITPKQERLDCVVVVDPLSTGAALAAELLGRDVCVVRVLSRKFPEWFLTFVPEGLKLDYTASVQYDEDLEITLETLRALPFNYIGVVAGAETGVELCDQIAHKLGLRGNDPKRSLVRRDKFLMGEAIRDAGVRAVKQGRVKTWQDATTFVKKMFPTGKFKVVLKPTMSAGSDGVFLCSDLEDLEAKFNFLMGADNALGTANESLVIQEFLAGTEFVVDSVSRDGVHKCVALWQYDKRPCNGGPFVYFGMEPCNGDEETFYDLAKYVHQCLDAVGIQNGPSHAEVMLLDDGPCLIEVGARPHGGEGTFMLMADGVYGYNQVDTTCDYLLDRKAFGRTPDYPSSLDTGAREVLLVIREDGLLTGLPRLDELKALPSFKALDMVAKVGQTVKKTVDMMGCAGSVRLLHKNPTVVERDAAAIREMELHGFFIIEPVKTKKVETKSNPTPTKKPTSSMVPPKSPALFGGSSDRSPRMPRLTPSEREGLGSTTKKRNKKKAHK